MNYAALQEKFNAFCAFCEKYINAIKETEFSRGYAAGVLTMMSVVILILLLKIMFILIFRRGRCKEILIENPTGAVHISIKALEDSIRNEIADIESVFVHKIRLYRKRKNYSLDFNCEYDGSDGPLPKITERLREKISTMFSSFFGIDNMKQINIKFTRLTKDFDDDDIALPINENIQLGASGEFLSLAPQKLARVAPEEPEASDGDAKENAAEKKDE